MIAFYDFGPVNVFDGDVAKQKSPLTFSVKGHLLSLQLDELIPLHKLGVIDRNLPFSADDVSLALSLPVTNLGSLKIHKGRKQGLKLYFSIMSDILYVFSFGEYQPGRFLCIFECAMKL